VSWLDNDLPSPIRALDAAREMALMDV